MDRLRLRSESGFTLIELLVVVAIIGILAAIAIPQFSAYRKRGYEAQVKADLRNAATAEEAYFASTQPSIYKPNALSSGAPAGYNQTVGVTMNATVDNTAGTFLLIATHANCAGVSWTYTSVGGVISATSCP
jgi:type IV pilus assembly protein PilA